MRCFSKLGFSELLFVTQKATLDKTVSHLSGFPSITQIHSVMRYSVLKQSHHAMAQDYQGQTSAYKYHTENIRVGAD